MGEEGLEDGEEDDEDGDAYCCLCFFSYISLCATSADKEEKGGKRKRERGKNKTHINSEIQQVKRTRIRLSTTMPVFERVCSELLGGVMEDVKGAAGELRHGEISEVEKEGSDDLFGNVEDPDLEGTTGSLAPALEDQGEQGEQAEGGLDDEGKGAEETAFVFLDCEDGVEGGLFCVFVFLVAVDLFLVGKWLGPVFMGSLVFVFGFYWR